jgi:hypothetical protein
MNKQFVSYEDRKCNEESDMHLYVAKEGKPTGIHSRVVESSEEQQRQPYDYGDREHAPAKSS